MKTLLFSSERKQYPPQKGATHFSCPGLILLLENQLNILWNENTIETGIANLFYISQ